MHIKKRTKRTKRTNRTKRKKRTKRKRKKRTRTRKKMRELMGTVTKIQTRTMMEMTHKTKEGKRRQTKSNRK